MKYETIKQNAKKIFTGSLAADWDRSTSTVPGPLAKGSKESFAAVLPFITMAQAEREELREFAKAFEASPADLVANKAKSEGKDSAWNQMVLRAREAGVQLINDWDVRMVSKLIELFPGCVPKRYHGKKLTCYMADNDACDWMVEIA